MKDTKVAFKLNCQCAIPNQKDSKDSKSTATGYCPIPSLYLLKSNIGWLRKMWLGDTCHTYDRANIEAQLECGIGLNNFVIANVT